MLWSPADLESVRYAGRALRTRRNRALWKRDPAAWVADRLGEHCWSKQVEIMHSLAANERTAVPSCHAAGKSHIASRAGLWWIDTADHPDDRFLVTTAPSWPQVKTILWRYMRQGHRRHDLPGRILDEAKWKIDGDEVGYGRKPADHDATGFQGIHAPEGVMVVLDEACGIPNQLFVAADALATNDTSRILAIGNPDDASAHFARCCDGRDPGWNVVRIPAWETPNLTGEPVPDEVARGLVSRHWVEDKVRRWGRGNPLFVAKVDAEFADAEDGLIPLSWIRAAHGRWHAWQDHRAAAGVQVEPHGRRYYGVDVAWMGEDKTALVCRQGDVVEPDGATEIETHAKLDTTETTSLVRTRMAGRGDGTAVVDVVGVGAGVYDQLSRAGVSAVAFNGSRATKRRDASGEWRFANLRSASWWHLRELLDPAMGATLALPPDDELTAELVTPKYEPRAGGVIVVESKDEIRKRLDRSPDRADAVVMSCWVDGPDRDDDGAGATLVEHADVWRPERVDPRAPVTVGAPDPADVPDLDDPDAWFL